MGTAPRTADDMTPAWLTEALRPSGVIGSATVRNRTTETIGQGAGLLGQLVRIGLEYDKPDPSLPPSIIAKLPTLEPGGREVCRIFQFYEREIRFYDDIAPSCGIRVPRALYTAMDIDADDYVLLLEDMRGWRIGDEVAGSSADEAELVVTQLAAFQRKWWNNPRLDAWEWLPAFDAPVQQVAAAAYVQAWEPYTQSFGKLQSETMLKIGEGMKGRIVELLGRIAQPPRTILHGDWRLDNLFFSTGEVAAIDWQISTKGRGAFDLAYYLSGCLEPDVRRDVEPRLLRLWHETVSAADPAYSFEQAMLDYRTGLLVCNVYTVIAIGSLDFANERGMALFQAWLRRRSAAIEDHNCIDLLT